MSWWKRESKRQNEQHNAGRRDFLRKAGWGTILALSPQTIGEVLASGSSTVAVVTPSAQASAFHQAVRQFLTARNALAQAAVDAGYDHLVNVGTVRDMVKLTGSLRTNVQPAARRLIDAALDLRHASTDMTPWQIQEAYYSFPKNEVIQQYLTEHFIEPDDAARWLPRFEKQISEVLHGIIKDPATIAKDVLPPQAVPAQADHYTKRYVDELEKDAWERAGRAAKFEQEEQSRRNKRRVESVPEELLNDIRSVRRISPGRYDVRLKSRSELLSDIGSALASRREWMDSLRSHLGEDWSAKATRSAPEHLSVTCTEDSTAILFFQNFSENRGGPMTGR